VPLARTYSVALVVVAGHVVEVEVDIANGLVGMILVGLPTPRWAGLPSNAGPFCGRAPGNYHGRRWCIRYFARHDDSGNI
jgi:hypothetical protein